MRSDKDEILRLKKEIVDLQLLLSKQKEPVIKEVEKVIEFENKDRINQLEKEIQNLNVLIESMKYEVDAHKTECDIMRTKFKVLGKNEARLGNAIFDKR